MGVTSVILFSSEGTGAFNSWNDYFTLTKRSSGSYYVSLRRYGIDTPGSSTLLQAGPFRRGSRLLDTLEEVVDTSSEWFDREWASPSDILLMLARIVEFAPPLAAQALDEFAKRLSRKEQAAADGREGRALTS